MTEESYESDVSGEDTDVETDNGDDELGDLEEEEELASEEEIGSETEEGEEEVEEGEEEGLEEDVEVEVEVEVEREKEKEKGPKSIDTLAQIRVLSDPTRQSKTIRRLTKYELTAIIGYRAQQIAEGSKPYVDVTGLRDPLVIAEKELTEGVMPLLIERPLPSTQFDKFTYDSYQIQRLVNLYHPV